MTLLRTLDDIDPNGKRILIRTDFNVPLTDGRVGDATRIQAAAETIREILQRGGRPIVMSHLGRPRGTPDPELSLAITRDALAEALDGARIGIAEDCIGPAAHAAIADASNDVVLLENLCFHPGEKTNDPAFTKALATLGDAYINDAFSACHRAHASITGVPERLPAVAGRLLASEIVALERVFAPPARPALALVGGVKAADKLAIIHSLFQRFDQVAVSGGVANTLLRSRGHEIGRSVYDPDMLDTAHALAASADAGDIQLIEPVDVHVADDLSANAATRTIAVADVGPQDWIVDLGPRSVERIIEQLDTATVMAWAGPPGAADRGHARAPEALARAVVEHTRTQALRSVAGGGETLSILQDLGFADGFSDRSLGGGAFLQWLGGAPLPGLQSLMK